MRTRREREAQTPDEALMGRYADGDGDAFDELFRRYEPRAYAFFVARTGSPDRAQDLYQELFLRIHRARHRYDRGRPFAPWLFQIAHRLLLDDVRRAYRSAEAPLGDRDPSAEDPGSDVCLAEREALGHALAALSPRDRYLLVSAKLDGVSYHELAAELGKSVEAVRKMASRALRRLRGGLLLHESLAADRR